MHGLGGVHQEANAAVFSPRLYAVLTGDGKAPDGAGVLRRMEEELRKRAEEVWMQSGNPDSESNWMEAERALIRPLTSGMALGPSKCNEMKVQQLQQQVEALTPRWAPPQVKEMIVQRNEVGASPPRPAGEWLQLAAKEAEIDALRRKHEAELQALRQEKDAELEALRRCPGLAETPRLRDAGPNEKRLRALQQELADTDRLLVQRNEHFRKVEQAVSQARSELRSQAGKLESQGAALAAACADLEAAERRCREKDVQIEELARRLATAANAALDGIIPAADASQVAVSKADDAGREGDEVLTEYSEGSSTVGSEVESLRKQVEVQQEVIVSLEQLLVEQDVENAATQKPFRHTISRNVLCEHRERHWRHSHRAD
mmetsp:Transcript_39601/g.84416  ORF Transcript_39601/g.84416 Transcript_39601/m.84416 type:complete len:375 (+) Transcript_39601:128-1252(+)